MSPEHEIDASAVARGEMLPRKPLVCRHHMGERPRDMVATTYAALILFSDRVVQILRDRGFTGWTTYPVEVYGKGGERIEGYHGFAVTGRCGPIDWSRGKEVRKPPPVPTGRPYDAWIGMYLDPTTWDGSDIFLPGDTTYTIVVEKVVVALQEAEVTNVAFTPLSEFERSWPV